AESDSVIATGDKRACAALYDSDCAVKALLKGKVICFETALMLLLKHLEFPTLAKSLTPARDYSQTVRVLLSQGERTVESSFREGLQILCC
ncbi:MAG: hypothetical protein V3T72_07800, partial [Thermoanaerobaculia bacterium]